jgi:hypothetical protein
VGTPSFSSDLVSPREKLLPFDNIMYAYHTYTGYHRDYYRQALGNALAAGLPVFVSEWGINRDPNTGELTYEYAHEFIDFMRQHKISWTNWSLSNAPEDYSAIRSDVTKLSGWTDEDLTISGSIIFEALRP